MACCARHVGAPRLARVTMRALACAVAVLGGLVAVPAPVAMAADAMAASTLGERAAQAFSRRWDVAAADIRLEWPGDTDASARLSANDSLAIRGDGADGRFVLEISTGDAGLRRMWVRAGVADDGWRAVMDLPRGVAIDSSHVQLARSVAWGGPGHTTLNDVIGWVARRPIAAGEVLAPPAIAPPAAVTAGEDVRVVVRTGAIELAVRGRALGTAAAGERIGVRLETGRRLMGVAARGGVVVVSNTESSR